MAADNREEETEDLGSCRGGTRKALSMLVKIEHDRIGQVWSGTQVFISNRRLLILNCPSETTLSC